MVILKKASPHEVKRPRHRKNIIEHNAGALTAEEHSVHTINRSYSQKNAKTSKSPPKLGSTGRNPLPAPACLLPTSHFAATEAQTHRLHHPQPLREDTGATWAWPRGMFVGMRKPMARLHLHLWECFSLSRRRANLYVTRACSSFSSLYKHANSSSESSSGGSCFSTPLAAPAASAASREKKEQLRSLVGRHAWRPPRVPVVALVVGAARPAAVAGDFRVAGFGPEGLGVVAGVEVIKRGSGRWIRVRRGRRLGWRRLCRPIHADVDLGLFALCRVERKVSGERWS